MAAFLSGFQPQPSEPSPAPGVPYLPAVVATVRHTCPVRGYGSAHAVPGQQFLVNSSPLILLMRDTGCLGSGVIR